MGLNIIRERFCWLGYLLCMNHQCIPQQTLYQEVPEHKTGPDHARINWTSTVEKDLQTMALTREAALNRQEWH